MEVWKAIPGYEDKYQVSTMGRVRRLPHGKVLRPGRSSNGYLTVAFWENGQHKSRLIQELVLLTFVGPRPKGNYIRHLDDNRANNKLENLCYGTPLENYLDVYRLGGTHGKLTAENVRDIRRKLAEGFSTSEIAARYNVCERVIRNIRAGRTCRWVRD